MTITVTQEDIDQGQPGNCAWCPIALAVNRACATALAEVSEDYVWVGLNGAELPRRARKFISRFDEREPVQPFSFRLDL